MENFELSSKGFELFLPEILRKIKELSMISLFTREGVFLYVLVFMKL